MLYPAIEQLSKKVGNSYILAVLVGKRAKQLEKNIPDYIEHSPEKAISLAAREIESGKVVASTIGDSDEDV